MPLRGQFLYTERHGRLYNRASYPPLSGLSLRSVVLILENPAELNVQTAAAVFSLLNDYVLSRGKPPLGFLNPWLYESGLTGFDDIVHGNNPGCTTEGFFAVEGWDPVRLAKLCLAVLGFADSDRCRSPAWGRRTLNDYNLWLIFTGLGT
jgi:hypothetical protein